MGTIANYWHTLRHLKPVQVYGRVLFWAHRPKVDQGHLPVPRPLQARNWITSVRRRRSLVGPKTFRLLNSERKLRGGEWDNPAEPKLWRYNLHYFDDLCAEGAAARRSEHQALISCWISNNAVASGTGWEPYPVSLRVVNWIKAHLEAEILTTDAIASLAVQTRWLAQRLEWHLLGNHLLANAKALIFAGVFFEGEEPRSWLQRGVEIYEDQLQEQFLSDGAHFELSPMYHSNVLEDVLDLVGIDRAYPGILPEAFLSSLRVKANGMRAWLAAMTHPDGEISFFNDAAFGIAPSRAQLEDYAQRLGFAEPFQVKHGATHLAASGYVRLERPDCVVLMDAALVGPDYIPGHAHADTLSVEVSLFGLRLFVNSGTSLYVCGQERWRQRATAAHNTVVVNGQNSSEVWGAFRVARRARPFDVMISDEGGIVRAAASHDGYCRLPGHAIHHREIVLGERSLEINDRISGRFERAQSRLHLHPAVKVDKRESGFVFTLGQRRARLTVNGGVAALDETTWHPEFGLTEPSSVIVITLLGSECTVNLKW